MTSPDASGGLDAAANALTSFAQGPATDAADAVGDAFSRTADRIASELGRAARSGELSISRMAAAIISDLSRLAIEKAVTGPLSAALGGLLSGGKLFGARADGGPVAAGGAYLVGERGPELFRPGASGAIGPVGGGAGVTVNIHLGEGADLETVRRSSGQVAAALARAVAGARRGI